nr:ABC transporter permease [Falsirhodobacter halotolerans]
MVLGAGAVWYLAIRLGEIPPYLLPAPDRVGRALWTARGALAEAGLHTLSEVVAGFALGAAIGMTLAIGMALSVGLRRTLLPVLTFSQTIPIFALAPLLTLWLGFGMAPKIAVVALTVLFPVAASWFDGLMRPDPLHLKVMESFGASHRQTFVAVRLPSARPALATGLRMAAVYAPVGAIIGEWVGGSQGLGAMMIASNARMKTDLLFAALAVTVALSLTFRAAIGALADRIARI